MVVTIDKVIEAQALALETSAQKAELIALTRALVLSQGKVNIYTTGGKHKAHGLNPPLHLVLSSPTPCFYPVAEPSSLPLVKE